MDVEKVLEMFEQRQTLAIRIFLAKHNIYVPNDVKMAYAIERRENMVFIHLYLDVPIKVLISIDKEEGKIEVNWIGYE